MEHAGADEGPAALALEYYRALDAGDYDLLADLLAAEFVHERPDRTLSGRERFVRFMRDERPQTDTSHPVDEVLRPVDDGTVSESGSGGGGQATVAVRGRLLAADGSEITAFVDVFAVADGRLQSLRTYTA